MVCALYFRIVTFTWTCNITVNLSKDFYNFYYNITGFTYWNICNFITDVTNFSYFIINIVLTHNILLYVSTLYVFQFSMRQQEWSLEIYKLSLSNRINPHSMGRVTKREGVILSSVIQRIHTRLLSAVRHQSFPSNRGEITCYRYQFNIKTVLIKLCRVVRSVCFVSRVFIVLYNFRFQWSLLFFRWVVCQFYYFFGRVSANAQLHC